MLLTVGLYRSRISYLSESTLSLNCKTESSAPLVTYQGAHQPTLYHRTFQIPYVHDYTRKMCTKQPEVIQTHNNVNVQNTDKNEAQYRKYKRLKLGGGQTYDRSGV